MRQILKVLAISLIIAMALQFIPATALRTYAENLSEPETVPETIDSISESAAPASFSLLVYIVFDNGTYDGLNRIKKTSINSSTPVEATYNYDQAGRVASLVTSGGSFTYRYDDNDNIEKILEVGKGLTEYIYDGFGQLKEERSAPRNRSILYTYDKNGNILTKTEYSGSNGAVGTPTNTNTYTYGNSQWKDLLTKYNGQTITYDAVGNPLTYRDGMTFKWKAGRRLDIAKVNGKQTSYEYDHNGLRIEKSVYESGNWVTHEYDYDGNLLIREKYGDEALWFVYDEQVIILLYNRGF